MQNDYFPNQKRGEARLNIFLLGILSLALAFSFFTSMFTPLPIALSILIFGRKHGHLCAMLCFSLALFIGAQSSGGAYLYSIYLVSWLLATWIVEIIFHDINPVKGLIHYGLIFYGLCAFAGFIFWKSHLGEFDKYLLQNISTMADTVMREKAKYIQVYGDDAQAMFDLLSRPQEMLLKFKESVPTAFFIGLFLFIWSNLYLVLKAHRFYSHRIRCHFTERELIDFKVPEYFVWPVIVGLIIVILGDGNVGYVVNAFGRSVLFCLGLFYFFQGFGIYLDFLSYIKITGLIRTILVIMTVMIGYHALVAFGFFDMWFNFRKYFKSKTDRGIGI